MPSISRAESLTNTSPERVSATMAPSAIAAIAWRRRSIDPDDICKQSYPNPSRCAGPPDRMRLLGGGRLSVERALERSVDPAARDQLVVLTLLDDLALVHHDDE